MASGKLDQQEEAGGGDQLVSTPLTSKAAAALLMATRSEQAKRDHNQQQVTFQLERLPVVVLDRIFGLLEAEDLRRFYQVSKGWKRCVLERPKVPVEINEPEGGTSANLTLDQEGRGNWDKLPPEILNMIFNQLGVADLLSLSVMSRNWQNVARDILKTSRECYVCIKNFTEDIQALDGMIASSNLMEMANGLHINLRCPAQDNYPSFEGDQEPFRRASYTSLDEDIRQCEKTRRKLKEAKDKLPHLLSTAWTYVTLQISHRHFWEVILSTIDALLVRELVSSTNKSLRKLVIGQDSDCYFLVGCGKTFPKLKVLHVRDEYTDNLEDSFMENFLFACAPNLQEVTGAMCSVQPPYERNPFVLVRMKNLDICGYDDEAVFELPECFSSLSGLHRLKLNICFEQLPEEIQFSMVLQSLETLEELCMETSALYIMCNRNSKEIQFPKLRQLDMKANNSIALGTELVLWKELPKLFPNLKQLKLSGGFFAFCEEDEPAALLPQPVEKQCHVPLEVQIDCNNFRYFYEHWRLLSEVYPNIKIVQLLSWGSGNESNHLSRIFSEFNSLEYLELMTGYHNRSVDAFLCGINFEEAKLLYSGPTGRINGPSVSPPLIVPIRPSVYNAKNLLEVKISGFVYGEDIVKQSWLIQVNENLPVRHWRHFKVTCEGRPAWFSGLHSLQACTSLLGAQVISNEAP